MDNLNGKWIIDISNNKLKILINNNQVSILNKNDIVYKKYIYLEHGYFFMKIYDNQYRLYFKNRDTLNIIYNNSISEGKLLSSLNKKPKIAYITAIYGPYEAECKPYVKQTIDSDFICFTNVQNMKNNNWIIDKTEYHYLNKSDIDNGTYRNSLINNKHTFNIAKYYKQQHYNIPVLNKYDIIIWLDGTIEIKNERASEYVLNKINKNNLIVTGTHGRTIKNKLEHETSDSNFYRYTSTYWFNQKQPYQDIFTQYQEYINEGYDEEYWGKISSDPTYGLWITCFLAINMNSNDAIPFLNNWYLQTLKHTTQDQIGFPYVCQKMKIHPYSYPDIEITGITHIETDLYIKHEHSNTHSQLKKIN